MVTYPAFPLTSALKLAFVVREPPEPDPGGGGRLIDGRRSQDNRSRSKLMLLAFTLPTPFIGSN